MLEVGCTQEKELSQKNDMSVKFINSEYLFKRDLYNELDELIDD